MVLRIEEILTRLGYDLIEKQDSATWLSWYQGNVKDFHSFNAYNGEEWVDRERLTLGMAKKAAEDWADVIINPDMQITVGDDKKQSWIDDTLDSLDFIVHANALVEKTFALGNGAFVAYKDGRPKLEYYDDRAIYPLRVSNKEVIDVAFLTLYETNVYYLNIHELQDNGKYLIRNLFFDDEGDSLTYDEVEEEVISDHKMFYLVKPAMVNNVDIDSPMGIPIFANAVAEMKSVDLSYTALNKEVDLGQMRVYIKASAMKFKTIKRATAEGEVDETIEIPIFDKNQELFYAIDGDETFENGGFIQVEAPQLRVEDFERALEKNLTMFGRKIGMGDDAYSFRDGTVYTNTTQVVSTNSKFNKTRIKFTRPFETALVGIVNALHYLEYGSTLDTTVAIDFDDSIVQDKEARIKQALLLHNIGVYSDIQLIMETENMNREEAVAFKRQQDQDKNLQEDIDEEGGVE
ncbi:phage portal protein [Erysipelothrix sp. HDW6C]|uniref:phage portal protein n=1 Tax=Erysipelothrix sp. HDW6C TaxID=2714930 RepID=UPI001407A92A|nr:phage portal protein [Erysipelothrix sp. HDW6C]QIK70847.1 phage portal protein [Erysipelothrix sp. HDW6C]